MRWLIIVIAALGLAACGRDNQALGVERDRAPGAGTQDQGQVDTGDYGRMQPHYNGMPDATRQGADSYGGNLGSSPGSVDTQSDAQSEGMEIDQRGGVPMQPGTGDQNSAAQPAGSIPEAGIEGVTPQSGGDLGNVGSQRDVGSGTQHEVGSDRTGTTDGRTNTQPGSTR